MVYFDNFLVSGDLKIGERKDTFFPLTLMFLLLHLSINYDKINASGISILNKFFVELIIIFDLKKKIHMNDGRILYYFVL